MRVFVSYARQDRAMVQVLVADLESLHHDVWYDREIVGGHDWWSTILEQISACDLFVPAVSSEWLASGPCKTELDYGTACHRPVLPIAIEAGIAAALPAVLARRQVVDCSSRNADTSLALVRALAESPPAPTLPNPLPTPPPAPVAPLAALGASLDAAEPLTADAQRAIVGRLGQLARTEDAGGARALARRMRQRAELLAELTGPLDALITPTSPVAMPPPVAPARARTTMRWAVVAAIVIVAAVGIAFIATRGGKQAGNATTTSTALTSTSVSSAPSTTPAPSTSVGATTGATQPSQTTATAVAHLGAVPTVRVQQATRFTDNPRLDASVDYIQLSGLDNKPLEGALNDRFTSDAADAIASFAAAAPTAGPSAVATGPSTLTRRISSQFATGRVLSFRLDESSYFAGGAHPSASFETVTIDLTTGKRLGLANLFRPSVDYTTAVVSEVRRQLIANYPDADASSIDTGLTVDGSSALRFWVIERQGIRFLFAQCDVMPCALGTPEVLVDFAALRPMLDPASALSDLLV